MATKRLEKKVAKRVAESGLTLTNEQLVGAYFDWLCSEIGAGEMGGDDTYFFLLKELYEIEFFAVIPNDGNRGGDGKALRAVFRAENEKQLEYRGVDWGVLEGPCRVLEMMIGLCKRMDFNSTKAEEQGTDVGCWFWQMIENLGLDVASDSRWILDSWVEKCRYRVDEALVGSGEFGFFGSPKEIGQTFMGEKKELWYQMNDYLLMKGAF